MDPPTGFSYTIANHECIIEHERTGMGCLKIFTGIWLSAWFIGCAFLIRSYFDGGKMADGEPIPLWFAIAPVLPWIIVAFLLLYLLFTRKTFRLTKDALCIETRLLGVRWSLALPRETITEIKQVKDGGEGGDSFHSWGLQIRSTSLSASTLQRLIQIHNFGRDERVRTILARLPYSHSEWLATTLARWSGVDAQLCARPDD